MAVFLHSNSLSSFYYVITLTIYITIFFFWENKVMFRMSTYRPSWKEKKNSIFTKGTNSSFSVNGICAFFKQMYVPFGENMRHKAESWRAGFQMKAGVTLSPLDKGAAEVLPWLPRGLRVSSRRTCPGTWVVLRCQAAKSPERSVGPGDPILGNAFTLYLGHRVSSGGRRLVPPRDQERTGVLLKASTSHPAISPFITWPCPLRFSPKLWYFQEKGGPWPEHWCHPAWSLQAQNHGPGRSLYKQSNLWHFVVILKQITAALLNRQAGA